jgi:hypothetical protein
MRLKRDVPVVTVFFMTPPHRRENYFSLSIVPSLRFEFSPLYRCSVLFSVQLQHQRTARIMQPSTAARAAQSRKSRRLKLHKFGGFLPNPAAAALFPLLSRPPSSAFPLQKKPPKNHTVFELLSSLPNYGAGASSVKIARATWRDAEKCFWSVSRASPSSAAAASSPKERLTGKAWGVLTWDGAAKEGTAERPVRIPGARKRVWRLVGEEEGGGKAGEGGGWKKSPETTAS